MDKLGTLGILFGMILSSYIIALLIGYYLGRAKVVGLEWFSDKSKFLEDPFTVKIYEWLGQRKLTFIKKRNWTGVAGLIFINNLLLVAFVGRTLYGLIFFFPYLLTLWTGLAQGVSLIYPQVRPGRIFVLEFGAYIFAATGGANLGLSFFLSGERGLGASVLGALQDLLYIYPFVIVMLMVAAWWEMSLLRKVAANVAWDDVDVVTLKEELIRKMKEERK